MNREEALRVVNRNYPYGYSQTNNDLINKIYNDFESRTCENCRYFKPSHKAYKYAACEEIGYVTVPNDFGCNKWEQK